MGNALAEYGNQHFDADGPVWISLFKPPPLPLVLHRGVRVRQASSFTLLGSLFMS